MVTASLWLAGVVPDGRILDSVCGEDRNGKFNFRFIVEFVAVSSSAVIESKSAGWV
jgi:hypothetical protein